jgi:hypothetical protein
MKSLKGPHPHTFPEMTLIKMATLRPLIPVSELMERVKGIADSLAGGVSHASPQMAEGKGQKEGDIKLRDGSEPITVSREREERVEEKVEAHMELEEPGDTWKDFMQLVRKKRPPLASKLEHGKLIELNNSMVRIGFNNGIYLDMISKEDIKALEEMLNTYLSRSMNVVITPLVKERKAHEAVKKEQTRLPIIEEALKVFGGRIVAENMTSN